MAQALEEEVLAPVRAIPVLDALRNPACVFELREALVIGPFKPIKVEVNGVDITDSVKTVEFGSDEELVEESLQRGQPPGSYGALVDSKGTRLRCGNPRCGRLWHGLPIEYCEGSHKWETE